MSHHPSANSLVVKGAQTIDPLMLVSFLISLLSGWQCSHAWSVLNFGTAPQISASQGSWKDSGACTRVGCQQCGFSAWVNQQQEAKITIAQIDLSWLKIRAEITHTHTGRKSCLCDLNPFKHFGSSFFQKWTCLKIALWDLAMDAWQVSASYLTWSSTMIQQSFMMYWCTMWQCVYMMHMYT